MKKYIALIILIIIYNCGFSATDKQLWMGFTHQGQVSRHWGYWLEVQHRTKNDFLKNLHADFVRAGGTYFINDDLRITAGYAYLIQFPSLNNQSFVRPEHRAWQQLLYIYKKKNFFFSLYLRNEQRFIRKINVEKLANGYVFRERLRYNVTFTLLFNKKEFKEGSIGMMLNDEVFVNAYSADNVKAFDQNRAFAGLFYNITDALQVQFGYMNIFSFTPESNEVVHALRLSISHNIDWRKRNSCWW